MIQIGESGRPIWWKNDEPATVEELQADIDAIIAGTPLDATPKGEPA